MNVCKQSGIKDCGLYAMAYATTLCDGEMPHSKDYIQSELRNHLYNCLQRSTALPFPSVHRHLEPGQVVKKKIPVIVHCSCRLPETTTIRMIECTNCDVWFHEMCEVINPKAWDDESYAWLCSKCYRKRKEQL